MRISRWVVAFLLITAAVLAQSDRGTITGAITDPADAMIPAAAVLLKNTDTGAQYETITTSTGNYTLAQLPVGVYELTVTAPGFAKYVQQGIRVQVAQTARVDVAMKVGSAAESVTVTSDAPLLKTEGAEQSYNMEISRMNSLPINFAGRMRNPLTFAWLAPGTSIALTSGELRTAVKVNGLPTSTMSVRIEGQDTTETVNPGTMDRFLPSVEAIQEVSMQSSNFAAEFGQVGGGLFNFTMKSGSSQYHGSTYDYFVNEFLNAGLPFTDNGQGELVRSRNRKHNFGFSGGGPVHLPKLYDGRNRTFFYANYERYYERSLLQGGFGTVPTDAFRMGDFSAALTNRNLGSDPLGRAIMENTIYDPGTNTTAANGAIVRTPYAGNIIPRSQFDPVALKIQALIPDATRPGLINNFAISEKNFRDFDVTSFKIDHNIGVRHKISFYDSYYRYTNTSHSGGEGFPEPISARRPGFSRTHTMRLNWDYTISPTILLHLGAGWLNNLVRDSASQETLNYDAAGALGLIGASYSPGGFPRINGLSNNWGGSASLGPTNANDYHNAKPTGVANLTWTKGNHTYKFGSEMRIDIYHDPNLRGAQGVFNFSAAETGLPSTQGQNLSGGSVGMPYASFLLGRVNTANVNAPQSPMYRKESYGFFAQDTWKVRRGLTLDYGLRYDYQTAPREIWDRISAFGPDIPNPAAGNLPGAVIYPGYGKGRCNCELAKPYNWQFAPRLGMAWQINPKTVLRAGWGLVYNATGEFGYISNSPILGLGWDQVNFSNPSFGDPAVMLRNGLQYDRALMFTPTYDPGARPSPGQIDSPPFFWDPGAARPMRVNQWNVGLQREITRNLVVEAAYVGNRSVWQNAGALMGLNLLSEERVWAFGLDINNAAHRMLLNSRMNTAAAISAGFGRLPYASYSPNNTVAQSLRPFPQFGNIGVQRAPLGSSGYDSLQAKATKRYSRGLDVTVAFTWQKELTISGPGGLDVFNRSNLKAWGSSPPFVLATAFNYELPGSSSNKLISALTSNWTIGGLIKYQSGALIGVPASNNALSSLLFRSANVNRVPGQPLFLKDPNCHCIDPNKEFVLNPAAWSEAPAGQFGAAAPFYNDYRWQRRPDEQLTLGRIFRVREGMEFSVRAEFFNIFNRTQLANPSSGNAAQTQSFSNGIPISGFGRIDVGSTALDRQPRSGQIVARFKF